jgi:release factor glutamine methyltransferase
LREGAAQLTAAGIEGARREARLLLAHSLGWPTAKLTEDPHAAVSTAAFEALAARRAAREPLALITGRREFWSLEFAVSPDTLVPRPDSETLIEAALAEFPHRATPLRVLDLGTGTGCLLLAVLHEFPAAFGVGVDRATPILALAWRNAASLGLADRTALLCGDWMAALDARFDLVLCNPPYIPAGEIAALMPEVALHEPRTALSGGADGLDAYRAIIPRLPVLLAPGGVAILEVGCGQAEDVGRLATTEGLSVRCRADLAGVDRALVMRVLA